MTVGRRKDPVDTRELSGIVGTDTGFPARHCYAEQWSKDGSLLRIATDKTNQITNVTDGTSYMPETDMQDVLMTIAEGNKIKLGAVLAWSNDFKVSLAAFITGRLAFLQFSAALSALIISWCTGLWAYDQPQTT